jgi:hypothetical protein
MKLSNSKEGYLQNNFLVILGPPKVGKTVLASTVSEFFPENVLAKVPTEIPDVLYWQFDKKGTESLAALNLTAPTFKFDELDLLTTKNGKLELDGFALERAILEAYEETKKRIAEGKTKFIIIDTLSAYDNFWSAYLAQTITDPRQNGLKFDKLAQKHTTFRYALASLGVTVVVLCHTKYKGDPMMGGAPEIMAANAKAKATQMVAEARILAAITGQSGGAWTNSGTTIWPISQLRPKGGPVSVVIHPNGKEGYESGCRYPGLADTEPGNLRKLFEKIKKGTQV